eukprot:Skav205748  [mRNA]  locus=scaffold3116:59238:64739:- [translate_table: standard]
MTVTYVFKTPVVIVADAALVQGWFQNFEDKHVPWVRFFLEPATLMPAAVEDSGERDSGPRNGAGAGAKKATSRQLTDDMGPQRVPSEEHIVMAGLSGGGWTTTVAAAVDPRIVPGLRFHMLKKEAAGQCSWQPAELKEHLLIVLGGIPQVLREKMNICEAAFVARGPKRPEDEAKLFALRTKRVHRSLATVGSRWHRDDVNPRA